VACLFRVALIIIGLSIAAAVATAYWTSGLLQMTPDGGLRQVTINAAGLGLILTAMLVTAPPMAAMFFQDTLGQFTPYAAIGPGSSTSSDGQKNPISVQSQAAAKPESVL
jgi:type IV secretion system protein VirB6